MFLTLHTLHCFSPLFYFLPLLNIDVSGRGIHSFLTFPSYLLLTKDEEVNFELFNLRSHCISNPPVIWDHFIRPLHALMMMMMITEELNVTSVLGNRQRVNSDQLRS